MPAIWRSHSSKRCSTAWLEPHGRQEGGLVGHRPARLQRALLGRQCHGAPVLGEKAAAHVNLLVDLSGHELPFIEETIISVSEDDAFMVDQVGANFGVAVLSQVIWGRERREPILTEGKEPSSRSRARRQPGSRRAGFSDGALEHDELSLTMLTLILASNFMAQSIAARFDFKPYCSRCRRCLCRAP